MFSTLLNVHFNPQTLPDVKFDVSNKKMSDRRRFFMPEGRVFISEAHFFAPFDHFSMYY